MKPTKPNKLTPGHNLKWEASRMMLPEHKEALLQHRKYLTQKEKPHLDEQRLEEFSLLLFEAYTHRLAITLVLFHPLEDRSISGYVEKLNPHLQQIKIVGDEEQLWIKLHDIVNIIVT